MEKNLTEKMEKDSNLQKLLDKIIREAEGEVKNIRKDTKKKLDKFEKETVKLENEIKEKELEKEASRLDFIRKRTETEFSQRARKILIQTKESIIDKVLEMVEKELNNFRNKKDYIDFIKQKLKTTSKKIRDETIKILVDKRDEKIVKDIISKIKDKSKKEFIVETPGIRTTGGFILTDGEERIRIDYTIDYILEESRKTIRAQIDELLFK